MLHNINVMYYIICTVQICQGLYITPTVKIGNLGIRETINNHGEDEWTMFKNNLGLTNEKVALLKAQTDQGRIKELLYEYMGSNSKNPAIEMTGANNFQIVDKDLLKILQLPKQIVRTSFKLELADTRDAQNKNGRPSKMSIKLSAAMPINEIINILNIYNRKSYNAAKIAMTTTTITTTKTRSSKSAKNY